MNQTIPGSRLSGAASIRPFSRSTLSHCFFLILICLAFFVPGLFTLPPVDRDESRFAQATSQMLETGDFIQIRFQNEPRNKKPIGIYWLQAASAALCGTAQSRKIWPYRIPSLIGAIFSVLLTFALGKRLFGERTGLLGADSCRQFGSAGDGGAPCDNGRRAARNGHGCSGRFEQILYSG